MKIPCNWKAVPFGLVFGCGPKFFGIAILDEIAAIYAISGRFLLGKLRLNFQHWAEKALIFYFLLIALTGFIDTQNINIFRYFVIVIFLLFCSPRITFSIDSMIAGAKAFLLTYLVISVSGNIFDLPVAFWQDALWVGTAYAAVFSLFSAWLCILFAKNVANASLIVFIYLFIAILADSRLQILLAGALVPAFCSSVQREYGGKINSKKIVSAVKLFIVTLLLVAFSVGFSKSLDNNVFKSVESSILDFVINDVDERDADRKDSNKASLNWAEDHPFQSIFGKGILTHQVEVKKYYPESRDGVVRPTGFSAMIVDGGIIFLFLMLLNAFVTFTRTKRISIPMLHKLGAIMVLALTLGTILVVNPFDGILFWLIILPSGVLPFALKEWVHRFNQEVLCKSNKKVQGHGE